MAIGSDIGRMFAGMFGGAGQGIQQGSSMASKGRSDMNQLLLGHQLKSSLPTGSEKEFASSLGMSVDEFREQIKIDPDLGARFLSFAKSRTPQMGFNEKAQLSFMNDPASYLMWQTLNPDAPDPFRKGGGGKKSKKPVGSKKRGGKTKKQTYNPETGEME